MTVANPSGPRRRRVLRWAVLAGSGAIAGCVGGDGDDGDDGGNESERTSPSDAEEEGTDDGARFPEVEDPPDAVYLPTHREAVRMLDPVHAGEYAFAPMVTYPHRFWLVSGRGVERTEPAGGGGVHLMVTAWDRETGTVVPVDAGVGFEITRDGDRVDERNPWTMLSQQMGFHFGDNVPLDGDGSYRVECRIGALDIRKSGAFEGRFDEPVTFEFDFEFGDEIRDLVLDVEYFDEGRWGERGALDPMGHGSVPYSSLPSTEELPGTLQGTPETGDAVLATTLFEPGSRFVESAERSARDGDEWYLAVSPRTPYNRCVLPSMGLEATVRGNETVDLSETIDDELGHHYGAAIDSVADGDEVTIHVASPPQVARHQGYETAFIEMPDVTVDLSL